MSAGELFARGELLARDYVPVRSLRCGRAPRIYRTPGLGVVVFDRGWWPYLPAEVWVPRWVWLVASQPAPWRARRALLRRLARDAVARQLLASHPGTVAALLGGAP